MRIEASNATVWQHGCSANINVLGPPKCHVQVHSVMALLGEMIGIYASPTFSILLWASASLGIGGC